MTKNEILLEMIWSRLGGGDTDEAVNKWTDKLTEKEVFIDNPSDGSLHFSKDGEHCWMYNGVQWLYILRKV